MVTSRSRRRVRTNVRPFVAFLLVACFGLLFGCRGPEDVGEGAFVFTEDDAARFRELADEARGDVQGSGAVRLAEDGAAPYLEPLPTGSGAMEDMPVLDVSLVPTYRAISAGGTQVQGNAFRVTNDFLNVRSQPGAGGTVVVRLERGELMDVLEFVSAQWAKVRTVTSKQEGFVSTQYIARMTSDEKLAEEKKKYEGQYYVNFAFVNVRAEPNQGSTKLGEIPGQAIVKPISIADGWAKVPFEGKEGYVSSQYLAPFSPKFLVRQERYVLPVLHYDVSQAGLLESMVAQVARIKQEGYSTMTFRDLRDQLLRQEQQDTRIGDKQVLLAVTGITPQNVRLVSDALLAASIRATFFLQTKDLGMTGITEKQIVTLDANGFDLQSGGHTGDDLRSLTNAQVELELKQSRSLLESFSHKPVFAIAYPQGGTNDRVMQLALQAGYLLGLSSTPDRAFTRDQFLRLPSFVIFPSMTPDDVVRMVKGS